MLPALDGLCRIRGWWMISTCELIEVLQLVVLRRIPWWQKRVEKRAFKLQDINFVRREQSAAVLLECASTILIGLENSNFSPPAFHHCWTPPTKASSQRHDGLAIVNDQRVTSIQGTLSRRTKTFLSPSHLAQ